jgi:hypothetical protein
VKRVLEDGAVSSSLLFFLLSAGRYVEAVPVFADGGLGAESIPTSGFL